MPTSWESRTTPNTGARRLARPPPKSPAPQAERRRQPEDDRQGRGRQPVDQALAPLAVGSAGDSAGSSMSSSTAVGPGSSTTASAAASYRYEVVR